jgi:hypothetical protein
LWGDLAGEGAGSCARGSLPLAPHNGFRLSSLAQGSLAHTFRPPSWRQHHVVIFCAARDFQGLGPGERSPAGGWSRAGPWMVADAANSRKSRRKFTNPPLPLFGRTGCGVNPQGVGAMGQVETRPILAVGTRVRAAPCRGACLPPWLGPRRLGGCFGDVALWSPPPPLGCVEIGVGWEPRAPVAPFKGLGPPWPSACTLAAAGLPWGPWGRPHTGGCTWQGSLGVSIRFHVSVHVHVCCVGTRGGGSNGMGCLPSAHVVTASLWGLL